MKIDKVGELVANLHDQTEYVIQTRKVKQALNHGLVLKTVHRVTIFNQNGRLKPSYIVMNTDLRKKTKNDFEKDFSQLMNNDEKTMENVKKFRDIKLVTTGKRTNSLVLEPNYLTTKFFTENLLAIGMKKQKYL